VFHDPIRKTIRHEIQDHVVFEERLKPREHERELPYRFGRSEPNGEIKILDTETIKG
jgi:hypothetical protein